MPISVLEGSRRLKLPDLETIDRHVQVVRLSALRIERLYPPYPENNAVLISLQGQKNYIHKNFL